MKISERISRTIFYFVFFIFGAAAVAAQTAPEKAANKTPAVLSPQEINTRLEAYLKPYFEAGDFSGAALIAQNDAVLAQKTFGLENAENGDKNKASTKFRVASLSKTFTAAAIVMLMEKGELKLSDPLSRFFPAFPNGQNITVEHLLRHRSGVGSLNEPKDFQSCYSANELVAEIGSRKPHFAPGTDGRYSNEGYSLLAAIIEKVSGESYENFLRKNIFQPLKMYDSGSFCSEAKLKNLAVGHAAGAISGTLEALPFNQFVQIGAGSIYSTAPDLYKWLKAVNENRLFQINKLSYPFGWGVREYTGNRLVEQSGLVEGFNAYMAFYPQERLYVVFLSNVQTGLFNRVPRDLKAVAFGGEFSRPPQISRTETANAKLEDYAGKYKATFISTTLNVIQKEGKLYFRWGDDLFARSLTPVDRDKFFHRAEYADIVFERDQTGQIEKIKWQAGSGEPFFLNKVNEK